MAIKTRNKVSVAFSMSGLTDIVFLLLIFFIILSTHISPPGELVDLPSVPHPDFVNPPNIAVTIKPDLSYYINGSSVLKGDLPQMIRELSAGTGKPQVILYVDQTVPTGETIEFLSECRANEFGIVIATKKQK